MSILGLPGILRVDRLGFVLAVPLALAAVHGAGACECRWMGPFVAMAREAPLVVRGVVRSHGGQSRIGPSRMEVEVLETIKGAAGERRLTVHGGDGMLCRPEVSRFPAGSQWVLALNGPGSKAGVEGGLALSICGEHWLRIEGDDVVGNFDDDLDQGTVERVPLAGFAERLAREVARQPRRVEHVVAEVAAGARFTRDFGERFTLVLEPVPRGWLLQVKEAGREEDLARLTPPLHFVPNPREIEGWQFRNADNTGPNEPGEKNVNAPGTVRRFVFSPEVGASIAGPGAGRAVTADDVDSVGALGKGRLEVLEVELADLAPGRQASIAWMRFSVDLSFPVPAAP